MPGLSDVWFVSSNAHKFKEAQGILGPLGIPIRHRHAILSEIQSESIADIALHKVRQAYRVTGGPSLVEDDGLFIDALGGFPGPYSSYVFKTIGNRGILRLLQESRESSFVAVVAYSDGHKTVSFRGVARGSIARTASGDGWGYDPIFVPRGAGGTFADIQKGAFSHRTLALRKFAKWYSQHVSGAPP